jgi:hypothetical protein
LLIFSKDKGITFQIFILGFQHHAEFISSGYKEVNRGLLFDFSFLSAPQVRESLHAAFFLVEYNVFDLGAKLEVVLLRSNVKPGNTRHMWLNNILEQFNWILERLTHIF